MRGSRAPNRTETEITIIKYSAQYETNPITEGYHEVSRPAMGLKEFAAAGGRISRLRIIGTRGGADVSYCHGVLPDGSEVRLQDVYFNLVPAWKIKGELIGIAKRAGVFAKEIGLLDESNWSTLY